MVTRVSYIVVLEQDVKAEAESDDKDEHDEKELEHGEADVPEHEDEDAEGGELLEVGEQVEPGHRQDERPYWPTPTLQKSIKTIDFDHNSQYCPRNPRRCPRAS